MNSFIVDLITPKGVVLEKTEIPQEYTVYQIVDDLIDSLNLPRFASEKTVDYSLLWVNQNLTLSPQQTLSDVGITNGDQLRLTSSVAVDEPVDAKEAIPEPPPSSGERTIEVVLSVLDLNRETKESFDLDLKVEDAIKIIAKKYNLPARDELDVSATYYIKSKALGRVLGQSETLRSARVPNMDRVSVLRQEIAG